MIKEAKDEQTSIALADEKSLIGALLNDPEGHRLDIVMHRLKASDFLDTQLGELFDVIVNRHITGQPVALPCLTSDARRIFGMTGPMAQMFSDMSGFADQAEHFTGRVLKQSKLRRLRVIASDTLQRLNAEGEQDPDAITAQIEFQLGELSGEGPMLATTAYDAGLELVARLEEKTDGRPVMLGVDQLDKESGGMMPGELVIVAARPGIGKTSLAMQMAKESALAKRPTLFVSLEMTNSELIGRVLCGMSGVDNRRIRQGTASDEDIRQIGEQAAQFAEVPLAIYDPPTATMAQIRAMARLQKNAVGLDLLVVDYIGLVIPRDRRSNRVDQVSEITAGLKQLAKELSIPVVALCQLNRQADGAEPKLSHLRESGSVEQDADIVIFIHKDGEDYKLIVGKHRHGQTGRYDVEFDAQATTFSSTGYRAPESSRHTEFDSWN